MSLVHDKPLKLNQGLDLVLHLHAAQGPSHAPPVKGPTSECVDNDTGIYFYHSSFGGNERDIFDDCTKLDDKPERQLIEICKWTKSGVDKGVTYGPAREVCRKRCGTCSGGPTGPAPTPTPPTASKAPNNLKEKYIKNETGNISYKKMKNRNPDCSDYIGSYFAQVENTQTKADLRMDFEISAEATKCVLTSNNIPNHDVGGSVKANADDYILNLPRNPVKGSSAIYVEKLGGKLTLNGILLNGVDLDMDSAFCYNPKFITDRNKLGISLGSGEDKCGLGADWYAIPAANPDYVSLYAFSGHPYNGRYHYHGDNEALSFFKAADLFNDYGSPVIGFAPDGFPIDGHYYYKMEESKVVEAESSW